VQWRKPARGIILDEKSFENENKFGWYKNHEVCVAGPAIFVPWRFSDQHGPQRGGKKRALWTASFMPGIPKNLHRKRGHGGPWPTAHQNPQM